MGIKIAFAGKGGGGKTSLAILTALSLMRRGEESLLIIDGDPSVGIAEAFGFPEGATLADVRDGFREGEGGIPLFRYEVERSVREGEGFDLLVMGRREGRGCYCFVNNLLKESLMLLSRNYRFLIVDCDAGMEHLSRGVLDGPDILFAVSDTSLRGLKTAASIPEVAEGAGIAVKRHIFILNRVKEGEGALGHLKGARLDISPFSAIYNIPEDPLIARFEKEGRNFLEFPPSPSLLTMEGILSKEVHERG